MCIHLLQLVSSLDRPLCSRGLALLAGTSVSICAEQILQAGIRLQACAALLYIGGGALGYILTRPFYPEGISRTFAIELAMKSSAFGYLLASQHFEDFAVRVPSAVSIVWMALVGSTMAVISRCLPPKSTTTMTGSATAGAAETADVSENSGPVGEASSAAERHQQQQRSPDTTDSSTTTTDCERAAQGLTINSCKRIIDHDCSSSSTTVSSYAH